MLAHAVPYLAQLSGYRWMGIDYNTLESSDGKH
jgi:hypothetical protein